MNHYRLNNGVEIPVLGFGTWKAADGEEAYQAVLAANFGLHDLRMLPDLRVF